MQATTQSTATKEHLWCGSSPPKCPLPPPPPPQKKKKKTRASFSGTPGCSRGRSSPCQAALSTARSLFVAEATRICNAGLRHVTAPAVVVVLMQAWPPQHTGGQPLSMVVKKRIQSRKGCTANETIIGSLLFSRVGERGR